jgi:hypothetical protein
MYVPQNRLLLVRNRLVDLVATALAIHTVHVVWEPTKTFLRLPLVCLVCIWSLVEKALIDLLRKRRQVLLRQFGDFVRESRINARRIASLQYLRLADGSEAAHVLALVNILASHTLNKDFQSAKFQLVLYTWKPRAILNIRNHLVQAS